MSAMPEHSPIRMTESEYLAFENVSESKHELLGGYIYDMAGASDEHSAIVVAITTILHNQRKNQCKVRGSDLRVKPSQKTSFFYPDVTIYCGDANFTPENPPSLTNPTVIIEVLSPSTEKVDRGFKAIAYREIPSLQDYILVSQDLARVEHYMRKPNGKWELTDYTGLDAVVDIASIGCKLALVDIYEEVDLPEKKTEE